jgi:ADP-heptose:LPS heptosyltransferase
LSARKVFTIDKGKKAKKRFLRHRTGDNLIHTTERYKRVFDIAGIKTGNIEVPSFVLSAEERAEAKSFLSERDYKNKRLIAIAPFAMHKTKQWPLNSMKVLLADLDQTSRVHTFLFGGSNDRKNLLDLAAGLNSTTVIAGEFSIRQELAIIAEMDVMISMDSSNLHMAAVSGVKTISLWGGTHPGTGFGPIGSQDHSILQIPLEELPCRPCTVYGKGECKLKEKPFKCLDYIKPHMVLNELKRIEVI